MNEDIAKLMNDNWWKVRLAFLPLRDRFPELDDAHFESTIVDPISRDISDLMTEWICVAQGTPLPPWLPRRREQ